MSNFVKILTGILGILAVIACLATVGIIGYSLTGAGGKNNRGDSETANVQEDRDETDMTPVPSASPIEVSGDEEQDNQLMDLVGHVHDYEESIDKKATCYQAGRLKYTCEDCGDYYYVDISSTGHVADDWEVSRKPTADREGLRVKKCIYCDEVVAQENIPYEASDSAANGNEKHVHQYSSVVERQPSCVLAGLRRYTCSCGSFYTEPISAMGHVATDWTTVEAATTTAMGREQRTCTVCGVVLDSRAVNPITPSPSVSPTATATNAPSSSVSPSASPSATPTAQPTASPTPTATPHTHNYVSYVLKAANCQEEGMRSFVCSCGSTYAEVIEKDSNNHTFRAERTPATSSTAGYTTYTCIRCGYSYVDNYVPATGK